ncbi:MAG: hypothetical protein ACLPXZ_15385 [Mycobacterium sp.]
MQRKTFVTRVGPITLDCEVLATTDGQHLVGSHPTRRVFGDAASASTGRRGGPGRRLTAGQSQWATSTPGFGSMHRHDVQEVELNTNLMDSDQLRRHYRFWALPVSTGVGRGTGHHHRG